MNGRVIFCTVLTAILAALYGSFPEECSFLAGKLGRAILSFADSDWVDESRVDYANGETALMYFSSTRNLEKVRSELEQGAIIDAQDLVTATASQSTSDPLAANQSEYHCHGPKFTVFPPPSLQDGNTALMRAALSGHEAVVHLLLSKGADPNVQTKHGGTALMHASFRGRTALSLTNRAPTPPPFHAVNFPYQQRFCFLTTSGCLAFRPTTPCFHRSYGRGNTASETQRRRSNPR